MQINSLMKEYQHLDESVLNTGRAFLEGTGDLDAFSKACDNVRLNTTKLASSLKSVAANMAIMIAIGLAIKGITALWDKANVTVEEVQSKIDDLTSSISTLKSEYQELSSKENLTSSEQKRLKYLEDRISLEERLLTVEKERLSKEKYGDKFTDYFDKDSYAHKTYFDSDDSLYNETERATDRTQYTVNEYNKAVQNGDEEKKLEYTTKLEQKRLEYEEAYLKNQQTISDIQDDINNGLITEAQGKKWIAKYQDSIGFIKEKMDAIDSVIPHVKSNSEELANNLKGITETDLTEAFDNDELEKLSHLEFGVDYDENTTIEEFRELLDKIQIDADGNPIVIDVNISDPQEKLSEASKSLNGLQSAYEEFKENGFVLAETISSISEEFSKLEGYELFSKIIGDPTKSKEDIQQAFDDIVKEYLVKSDTLNGLVNADNSTIQTYIANLKAMGITNAEELINNYTTAINSESQLIKDAETELLNGHIQYVNGKMQLDADYLNDVSSKNSTLVSSLGSAYKDDYNNWTNLLTQKAKAYNEFVNAIKGSQANLGSGSAALSAKGQAQEIIRQYKAGQYKNKSNDPLGLGKNSSNGITKEQYESAIALLNTYNQYEAASNALKIDLANVNTNFGTSYSGGSSGGGSGSSGNGSSGNGSGLDKVKESFSETIDWIEKRIEKASKKTESAIDKIDKKLSFKSAKKAIKKAISATNSELNTLEKAKNKYQEKAKSVGLSKEYRDKVDNGKIDIQTITDENLKNKIEEYQKWHDKIQDVKDKITEVKQTQTELNQSKLELLITKYENLEKKVSNANDRIQNKIDLKESWGSSASVANYTDMNKNNKKQIKYITAQNTQLKNLQKTVKKGSEAWYEYQERIDSNNASLQTLKQTMVENAKAAAELAKAKADKKVEKYDTKDELYDAKINNATTAKSKNTYINKKISTINNRQTAYNDAYKSSSSSLKKSSKSILKMKNKSAKVKDKTEKKNNKTYNNVLKKVKSLVKAGKRISTSVINEAYKLKDNGNLYNACIKYNAYYDETKSNKEIADLYKETSKQDKADLAMEKFNNIATEYDYAVSSNERTKTSLNNKIALAETQGKSVNSSYYRGLISAEVANQKILINKRTDLQNSLDKAVSDGSIKKGSDEWYEMCESINEVTNAIEESTISVEEYNNAIRQLEWNAFDNMIESLKRVNAEAEYYIKLMSNDKLMDDNGNFTDAGNATMVLRYANAEQYGKEAQKYLDEYNRILNSGDTSEDAIARMRQMQDAYWDCKLAAEGELDAIKDLMREGYDAQIDYLGDLISKYQKLRDAEKEAYDYQRNIEKQVKNIANLQKQLKVLGIGDTEESKKRVQEIKLQLEESLDDLESTEYERFVSDTDEMLDDMMAEYKEFVDGKLENISYTLKEILSDNQINYNSIVSILTEIDSNLTNTLKNSINGNTYKTGLQRPKFLYIDPSQLSNTPKFATGGAISGLSGDRNLIRVADKERVLTPVQNELWEKWTDNLPQLVNLSDQLTNWKIDTPDYSHLVPVNRSMGDVSMSVNIDELTLPNVSNYQEFKSELIKDNQFEKVVQSMTVGKLGKNSNSFGKYRF